MKRLTNENIDNRLVGRSIIRIDDYIINGVKINFKCLKCQYIWLAMPNNILNNNRGCPKCAGRILNDEEINCLLLEKNIKKIGLLVNSTSKIEWQCLVDTCGYIWKTSLSFIKRGTGCPRCNKVAPLTNEYVDTKLIGRNIKRLNNVGKTSEKISWMCLFDKCSFVWKASPNKILDALRGCPKCGGSYPLNNEEVDKKLLILNIKRIGNYLNKKTKINFKCLKCNHIWHTTPNSIINNKTGCPICNISGINEKRIFSLLKENNIEFNYNFPLHKLCDDAISKKYKLDFYLPKHNIIIEYNGSQHYSARKFGSNMTNEEAEQKLIKQQKRDKYVNDLCLSNGIKIIWIDGRKYAGQKLIDYFNIILIQLFEISNSQRENG